MKSYFLFSSIVIISCIKLSGQAEGMKIVDNGYEQMKGEAMKEHADKIYIAGQVVEYDVNGEWNIHLTSFDLNGNILKSRVWNNPDEDSRINDHSSNNDLVILNDEIYMAFLVAGTDCLIKSNLNITEIEKVVCYDHPLFDQGFHFSTDHFIEYPENQITILAGSGVRTELGLILVDPRNIDNYQFIDIGEKSTRQYEPISLLRTPKNENLFVLSQYIDPGPYSDNILDEGKTGIVIIELNQQFQKINEYHFGENILSSGYNSDAFFDSDENLIIAVREFDPNSIYNSSILIRPLVMKINTSNWQSEWSQYVGVDGYWQASWPAQIDAIVESHDKNGYIYVGDKYPDQGNPRIASGMMIGKISYEGEELWRKYIVDDFHWDEVSLRANDLIATSDGNYMLSCTRGDKSSEDQYNSRVQTGLIKFDDQGDYIFTTSIPQKEKYNSSLRVFPNPSSNLLFVENDIKDFDSWEIRNSLGQLISFSNSSLQPSNNFIVETSSLSSGNYYLSIKKAGSTIAIRSFSVLNK